MDAADLRDRFRRHERLDEDGFHLFPLDAMVRALRSEPEYRDNGHTGVTLLKTAHLRVVLEAARTDVRIGEHVVAGPTVIHVLEGAIRVASEGETRIARAGEMVVIPHERQRELRAEGDAAFLWALSMDWDVSH